MCGIAGYISLKDNISHSHDFLNAAINSLHQRGPDNTGIYRDEQCELGHARLSIIDTTSAANQPMTDNSGRYVIVFNGEIYNYRSIKNKLEHKGHKFITSSDTEVVLYSFIEFGAKCIEHFNGFFSFCIYDKKYNSYLIARDRFGIKPLYYSLDEKRLIFGSELKAILAYPIDKTLDRNALNLYFRHNYIPAPFTILNSCKKLLPGELLTISKGKCKIEEYYKYYPCKASDDSYEEAKQKINSLLINSVESRLVADVPLGTFLSGGVDSSVISLIASRLKTDLNTFSIGFPDEPLFDESQYAEEVAKHINSQHHTFQVTNNTMFQHLNEILDYMDEPFADSSAINVYILSKQTRDHVTVSLSGDGADELFSGYNKHAALLLADKNNFRNLAIKNSSLLFNLLPQSRNSKIGNLGRKLVKLSYGLNLSSDERYLEWASFMRKENVASLTKFNSFINPIEKLNYNQFNDYLYADFNLVLANDMLKKVDLMSMANSLEVRTPFLDHNLVEYVFSLPDRYKIDNHSRKKILKETYKDSLPYNVFNRKKHGFEVPLEKWFQNQLKSFLKDKIFNNNILAKDGYLDPIELKKMESLLFKGNSGDLVYQTWGLIVLESWYNKHIV